MAASGTHGLIIGLYNAGKYKARINLSAAAFFVRIAGSIFQGLK